MVNLKKKNLEFMTVLVTSLNYVITIQVVDQVSHFRTACKLGKSKTSKQNVTSPSVDSGF